MLPILYEDDSKTERKTWSKDLCSVVSVKMGRQEKCEL